MEPAIQTQQSSAYRTIGVEPLTPSIGAEVSGFKMSGDLPEEQIIEIREALLEWKVIFFRDQDVEVSDHVAFGRRFGELEIHPFTPNRDDYPEVIVIHHDENSKIGENQWHSDVTWRREPSLGSILRARIVPPVGGDTLFADMISAYENLSEALREQVEHATAIHSFEQNFGKRMTSEKRKKFLEQFPPVCHPVVRTHPETGKKALYVSRPFTSHIEGLESEESASLLRRLYHRSEIPERQVRFRWRENSVAFWDNRAVQHYAAFDYLPHTRRVERVTIAGDKPY
jgi:taurine dioxygenase